MKNAWICLLLVLCIETCCGILKCNKNENCTCIPGQDEFEFQCPKGNEGYASLDGLLIHVKDNEQVKIDCTRSMETFDETLLPEYVIVPKTKNFLMRSCPLPKRSFQDILNRFSIQKLKQFQFSYSDLENVTLTKDYFVGLDELVGLELNFNNLVDIEDDIFSSTPNLTSLDLQGNQILLKRNLFKYTPSLKWLYLAGNEIRNIPKDTFQPLQKLQTLQLWNNNLSTLNEFMFEGLVQLTTLELSKNKIENISENTFYNLTNLKEVNLSLNEIKTIPSNLFLNNKKLKLIRISRNTFKLELSDLTFSNLPELKCIELTNSKIDVIPEHIFENSTNLQKILLDHNNLKYIPKDIFEKLQNLEEINLNNNQIQDISNIFASLKKLKKLFLRNNDITEIGETAFQDLKNLEEIDLSKNKITKIYYTAFKSKENLKKINLSHNFYSTKEHFAVLQDVINAEDINLSYNLISQIDDVIYLDNKIRLKQLDLSNNRITNISLKDLRSLGGKLFIKLENNNITTIDFYLTRTLALQGERKDARSINLDSPESLIDLSNNPFVCDCLNYDLVLYLKNEITPEVQVLYNIQGENLTCASPPELKDILVKDLQPSLFVCPLEKLTDEYTGCPDKCSCSWRPSDESIIIDCAKKNFTEFPEIYVRNSTFLFHQNQIELHLEGNGLEIGPHNNLTGYENVTRLFLSHNKLKYISWLPPKLRELHLDNNKLKSLEYKVLDTLNSSHLTNLTLGNNPWTCDCKADNLSSFLRHHIRKFDTKNIYCFNSTTRLIELNRNDLCHEWQNVYTALLVMFFLLLLAITVALYYRYQEEIKAWLWIHNYCLCCVGEEDLDKDKIYDAFISYSHKDEDFVTQNLLPVLEGGPNSYNLCLHGRNWVPGEFIAKQIITSVMESKRTIVILSPNFLESVWGLIEFRTAHTQAMTDGRARVIVVLYGDIDMDQLDPELKMYLKTNTYVKWGDPFFWNKLKYALPHRKRTTSTINTPDVSQKHANIMNGIDDKFKLVASPVTVSPGSTPPVLTLDPTLLKKHPLHFVPTSELTTPPAELGTLLTTANT